MRSPRTLSIWACLVLALAALSTRVDAQVYHGNDTGGIIPWSCENEADARAIAAAHCARYDKYARITSVKRRYGDYIGFNCLWRRGIAPYQIPAVGTRRACYSHARAPRLYPRVRVRY
jgi:hypothetical protein